LASTLWTDDRYLSVWEVGDYFPDSNDPQHPSMDIRQSNGRIYGAWSNYAASAAYYARPNSSGTARTEIFATFDPPEWTDVVVEAGSNTVHNVILENFYNGGTSWGSLAKRINQWNVADIEYLGDDDADNPNYADGRDEQLYQFQNPRMVVTDEANDVAYIAYYDSYGQALKYAVVTGNFETFAADNGHRTDGATVVDGIDDYDGDPSDSGPNVGQYLDIGMDPDDGVPVIVYYDVTNKTMKIARGQNAQPYGTGEWNITNVLPANSFSGQFVSMKLNAAGDLFVSYYKVSTGDLMFIRAADVDGTGTGVQYTFGDAVAIDTDGAVGASSDIYLRNGFPVISYLNSSQIGTYAGLKVARYIGDGSSWTDPADWEHEVVPAGSAVFNKRTSIVAMPTGGWDVAVGYASSTFDLAYRRVEQ
jgi:hypothetical protein